MVIKRQYPDKLKLKVIAEALEGKKTYKQIGNENGGVHPTTIVRWVRDTRQGMLPEQLSEEESATDQEGDLAKTLQKLKELQNLQIDWEKERRALLTEIWMVTTERDHWKAIVREKHG